MACSVFLSLLTAKKADNSKTNKAEECLTCARVRLLVDGITVCEAIACSNMQLLHRHAQTVEKKC